VPPHTEDQLRESVVSSEPTTRIQPTFCRICESECGVLATVEGERIVDVRADKANPHSQGFMCTKARAMLDVVEDPERVRQPLKRVGGPGDFRAVSWDEAIDDISTRLAAIIDEHGPDAFATYSGNPTAWDSTGKFALGQLRGAIGSRPHYSVIGEDHGAFAAAVGLQYGSTALMPRPDLWRTDFLLVAGANPWVSKGSIISEPLIRQAMTGIVERGGRVVVVDPRRTETARTFEHLPIRPGEDPWFFLGMLHVLVTEGLVDRGFAAQHATGLDELSAIAGEVELDECADRTGIAADTILGITRAFATAPAAAAYGRMGTTTQRFGTLTNLLLNAVNIVTGNVGRPGGVMFGWAATDMAASARRRGAHTYAPYRTRTLGLPVNLGSMQSQNLWREITEPGEGQTRALLTYAANPVLSSGAGGARLAEALDQLDLHVSFDLYVTETSKYAHYLLPGRTFYERADVSQFGAELAIRPVLYASEAVIAPPEGVRPEWAVLQEIARRMGCGPTAPSRQEPGTAGQETLVDPMTVFDEQIRSGPLGDGFGDRPDGWSLGKLLRDHPHGVALAPYLPVRDLGGLIAHDDGLIHLVPEEMLGELARIRVHRDDPAYPLRAIGLREIRSHNSWMHNSPRLVPAERIPRLRVHPDDARAAGLVGDEDRAVVESAAGSIVMAVELTADVMRGTVAIPHGWGHDGGWTRANAAGGANSNALTSSEPSDLEALAGMSILNGIPVRLRSLQPSDVPQDGRPGY
jgi:anaerobic selenocysteine-containing dehydrogenase